VRAVRARSKIDACDLMCVCVCVCECVCVCSIAEVTDLYASITAQGPVCA
jgi:hypothetical protein